ncbi:MAG: ATPase, T2SS/T4P/T4SS family [Ignavibacteriaceae bacterium]|nr:ATPase, T2SS/T4P/T4SS family [Ignavibacteriaceae bacterium]
MITENEIAKPDQENIVGTEDRKIINKYVSIVPAHIKGPDRVSLLMRQCMEMPVSDRVQLNNVVNRLLRIMVDKEASDIELGGYGSNDQVWLRIYGKKEPVLDFPKFTKDEAAVLILSILNDKQIGMLDVLKNLDFSYSFEYPDYLFSDKTFENAELRMRGDAYFDVDCLAMNMRSIVPELRTLEQLEFPPKVVKALSFNYIKQGLVLITGVTGTGKSTTLDAIVEWHNQNSNAHIVTIASPLEYVHKSRKCMVRQREVGRDVKSFHEGVVQALRQDLDIMVIGEMRDQATILAALEVTDTGHKVFSTLHTSSAVESLDRIIAEVNDVEQERVRIRLADTLTAVISQKLVPGLDGKLILAREILIANASIRAAIKNNNTSEIYMMINAGSPEGMITMEQDLKRLYLQKKISLEMALQYANNKDLFKQIIGASL